MAERIVAIVLVWALFFAALAIRHHHRLEPITDTGPIVWASPR